MVEEVDNYRVAVIDLGTNTFDLIIVEHVLLSNQFKTIHTDKSFVHLGERGIMDKMITEAAFSRAEFALEHFILACRSFRVKDIKAFGTSALRDAKNSGQFVNYVNEHFGIEVKIISGEDEAQFIYEGVKGIHSFDSTSCIMDIGGGSTEFIFASQNRLLEVKSLDIGVSRLLQLFEVPDQMGQHDINQLEEFMDDQAGDLFLKEDATTLIGAAGSFETFYQLVTAQSSYDEYRTHEIPFLDLIKHLDRLILSSYKQRCENIWIPDYRRKMIHITALQTRWVIRRQKIERCYFSPAALKEGVLFSHN